MKTIELMLGGNGALFREGIYVGQITNRRRMPLPKNGETIKFSWDETEERNTEECDAVPQRITHESVESDRSLAELLKNVGNALTAARADLLAWRDCGLQQRRCESLREDLVPCTAAFSRTDAVLESLTVMQQEVAWAIQAYTDRWPVERRVWETTDGQLWPSKEEAEREQAKLCRKRQNADEKTNDC